MNTYPESLATYAGAADMSAADAIRAYSAPVFTIAHRVARSAIAHRGNLSAHDCAMSAIEYMSKRRVGRVYMASAADGAPAGVSAVKVVTRSQVKMAHRSAARTVSMADPMSAGAMTGADDYSDAQYDARLAALDADGRAEWADRDMARAEYGRGITAAPRERTIGDRIELLRGQALARMLTPTMRIHHATADPATAGDYDASYGATLEDRGARRAFIASFGAILADLIECSPNAAVRTIPRVLADLTPALAQSDAKRAIGAAVAAESAADGARESLDALAAERAALVKSGARVPKALASDIKRADMAWRKLHASATGARNLAALASQVFVTLRDRGTVTLADLVAMSVHAATPTAGAKLSSQDRRDAADASKYDRESILTLLGLDASANGRANRAIREAIELAAERAADTAVADASVTLPNLRTDRAADRVTYLRARNAARSATVRPTRRPRSASLVAELRDKYGR